MMTIFEDLRVRGFATVAEALSPAEVTSLVAALAGLAPADGEAVRAGARDLFARVPAIRHLAGHPSIFGWPSAVLGSGAFAVRALLFDKTPETNWRVSWHQDLSIPIRQRAEVPGFGPWSEKAGIPHVQPPARVLERMLAVRLHLDPCDATSGPVRVLPGTHRKGKLSPSAIDGLRASVVPVEVHVPAGGLLLMHPLLLHASSPATHPGHRRVIHLEYANDPLPCELDWHERHGSSTPSRRNGLTRLGRRYVSV